MHSSYCPLDPNGREYYAELVAKQLNYQPGVVLTYLRDWCGS